MHPHILLINLLHLPPLLVNLCIKSKIRVSPMLSLRQSWDLQSCTMSPLWTTKNPNGLLRLVLGSRAYELVMFLVLKGLHPHILLINLLHLPPLLVNLCIKSKIRVSPMLSLRQSWDLQSCTMSPLWTTKNPNGLLWLVLGSRAYESVMFLVFRGRGTTSFPLDFLFFF